MWITRSDDLGGYHIHYVHVQKEGFKTHLGADEGRMEGTGLFGLRSGSSERRIMIEP